MEIFKHIDPLRAFLKDQRLLGKSIGLVPTMGALHPGHMALITASKQQNSLTVSSIYINPTQFNNTADLEKYPRMLDKDTTLLRETGCDVLFTPDNNEMYGQKPFIKFDFSHLDKIMEGKFRPGHFSGVALVVSKLFHIVQPDQAYFGQKDFQQFVIIRQLVNDLQFNITLHCIPTLREKDGLAMSSRNLRLSPEHRQLAGIFYKALLEAKQKIVSKIPVSEVKQFVEKLINGQPQSRLEYFELADSSNLNLLNNVSDGNRPIMCIAGYIGEIRLIDNMYLD
jgi:pantoate--beta-alanine ligase